MDQAPFRQEQADACQDFVDVAGKLAEHPGGVGSISRLPHHLAPEDNGRVSSQHHRICGSSNGRASLGFCEPRDVLRRRFTRVESLVERNGKNFEVEPGSAQQIRAPR
jgi:hypothetical protein